MDRGRVGAEYAYVVEHGGRLHLLRVESGTYAAGNGEGHAGYLPAMALKNIAQGCARGVVHVDDALPVASSIHQSRMVFQP